jgi:hypothetical protein
MEKPDSQEEAPSERKSPYHRAPLFHTASPVSGNIFPP